MLMLSSSKSATRIGIVSDQQMSDVVQASLQKVYHNQPSVSCQLLKLAADVVEAQISFVQVDTFRQACTDMHK